METRQSILEASQNQKTLFWPVPKELEQVASTTAREDSIVRVMESDDIEVGAASQGSSTPSMLRDIFDIASKSYGTPELSGIGLELGAGIGLLGIVAAENKSVEAILALELVKPFVERAIPAAAKQILGKDHKKIIPVYGSFEDIKISDNQIDFALQIESLHHADYLDKAAKETFRVLKPGGFLYSIDRSHPDKVSDKTLKKLLDHVYPYGFLIKRGYPTDLKMTRRENGEHEIRDKEWKKSFEDAGFTTEIFKFVAPKLEFWHVKKRLACLFLSWTPKGKQIEIPIRSGVIRGYILQKLGVRKTILGSIAKGKQERWMTVMIFRKPIKA
jgi:ubiquinone/menaquinone biosynthesis C-methylase UbiE